MSWQDFTNAAFEFGGFLFILPSIVALHRDRVVRGITTVHVMFFASWGYWNIYYYPHLDQTLSFYAACLLTIVNTIWANQILWYRHLENKREQVRDELEARLIRANVHPGAHADWTLLSRKEEEAANAGTD